MGQHFYAHPTDTFTWPNGAIGHRTGSGSFDCLGPYAKVRNCPIEGTNLRLTCYATGYADTYFSVPACTRHKGKYISGYFSMNDGLIEFRVMNRHAHRVGLFAPEDFETIPCPVPIMGESGWWHRVRHIKSGEESSIMRSWECDEVIRHACKGELKGSFLAGVKP